MNVATNFGKNQK